MGCGSSASTRTTELETTKLVCKYKMDSRNITLYLPEDFDVATAQATADGKIVTFYQDTEPTEDESSEGDLWVDTSDKNKSYRHNGTSWELIRDTDIAQALSDAATAQAASDGKIVSFYQDSVPTAEDAGDLWFDTNDNNKPYRATSAGDDQVKVGEWEPVTQLNVDGLSDISPDLGAITAGSIILDADGFFKTASSGKAIIIDNDGLRLYLTSATGKYSTFKYGDGTKYGSGCLAYIHHSAKTVPFYIAAEQTVADLHFYARSSNPSGAAEIGDTGFVSGKPMFCTGAGTPGTWKSAVKINQQAHEADASASHTVADTGETVDRSDIDDKLDALGSKINAILAKLETAEVLASS